MKWDQSNYGAHTEKALTARRATGSSPRAAGLLHQIRAADESEHVTEPGQCPLPAWSGGPSCRSSCWRRCRAARGCGAIAVLANALFGIEATFLDVPAPPSGPCTSACRCIRCSRPATNRPASWRRRRSGPGRGRDRPLLRDVRADRQPQRQRRERHLDPRQLHETGDGVTGSSWVPANAWITGANIESEGSAGAGDRCGGDARAVEHPGWVVERAQVLVLLLAAAGRGAQRLRRRRRRHEGRGLAEWPDRLFEVGEELHLLSPHEAIRGRSVTVDLDREVDVLATRTSTVPCISCRSRRDRLGTHSSRPS